MGEDKIKRENRMAVLASVQGHDSTVAHSFNHTGGQCPKCGCQQHKLMFCAPNQRPLPSVRGCDLDGEHLHRMCAACCYVWVERCLDQAMLSEEKGELTAESEMAAALAAVAHRAGGLSLARAIVGTYRGWVIHFRRDPNEGTLEITAEPPPAQRGEIVQPEPPSAERGAPA